MEPRFSDLERSHQQRQRGAATRTGTVISGGITKAVSNSEGKPWRAGARLRPGPIETEQGKPDTERPNCQQESCRRNQTTTHKFGQHQNETNSDKQRGQMEFGVVRRGLAFIPGVEAVCEWGKRREDQDQD